MTPRSTYHTHTDFCDGKNTAEQMLTRAIELGCTEYGFSGHIYTVGEEDWCMSREGTEAYRREVLRLREMYGDKIKVYLGVEYDLLSDEPVEGYDYVIGSVHALMKNGVRADVDGGTYEMRLENINKLWGGDPYAFAEDYFKATTQLYARCRCDIIGHLDIVCKFNEKEKMFDERDPRYRSAALAALDEIMKTPSVIEFNTGGVFRAYRSNFYPDGFLLERIAEYGRPMVINSDTHSTDSVLFGFEEAARMLDRYGIDYYYSLDDLLKTTRSGCK